MERSGIFRKCLNESRGPTLADILVPEICDRLIISKQADITPRMEEKPLILLDIANRYWNIYSKGEQLQ